MATKKVTAVIKLQCPAGAATPAPPIGPALGPTGINTQQFVTQFNDRTKDMVGSIVPVILSVYEDRTFSFITKTPPASDLLRQAAGIERGAHNPGKEIAGKVLMEKTHVWFGFSMLLWIFFWIYSDFFGFYGKNGRKYVFWWIFGGNLMVIYYILI